MHIITDLYEVESCRTVLTEKFINNKRKWEEVNIASEKAIVKDGCYWMSNTSKSSWNYYKTKVPLKKGEDFLIETIVELEKREDVYGHFGLVWGFDEDRKFLNRFTLSADGKRALIMHFEKDHNRIFHRFQNRKLPKFDLKKPIHFSIIKMGEYFHFLINKQKVYMAHESVFCSNGVFAGYYIEPQLSMKSTFFEVKKIKLQAVEVITGMQQLMITKPYLNLSDINSVLH